MGGFCSKREDRHKESPVVSELTHAEREMARKGAGLAVVEASSKKKGSSLGDVLTTTTKKAKETVALTARKGAATVQRAGSLVRDSLDGIGSALTGGGGTYGSGIFTTGAEPKGKRIIGILAFEVASVIVKAMNIKVSLGEEDMEEFRQTVLNSAGVRTLVSDDETTVWKIAASDKRAELQVFISEVIRLGKLAEDPQWRQLERVFMRVGAVGGPGPKLNVQHLENELANLENLVATTGDLYHELHGLDSLQSNLKRRQDEEDAFPGSQRADTLPALRLELRQQEKEVKQLKKKSLWNRRLDQIVELLVDVVFYIHQQMVATFGPDVMIAVDKERHQGNKEDMWKLGVCGLALHYSNIVNTVDNMVSRPNSVAPNSRDSLYQMLPPKMKSAVRGRILGLKQEDDDEESVTEIRGRLDEILDYIVPMAGNTIRYFSDKRLQGHSELQLLQTLHHADQRTTDAKLLELVVGLHFLISRAKGTQAKALTKSQILNQSNIQLPGLPLLGSQGGLAPGLQLPPPKSAFHHLNKQPHNIKNSAELGIHYPGGPLPNAPGSLSTLSSTGGSPLNPFLRSLNNSEGDSSLPSALLEQQKKNKTATTTTFSEEGVAVIPVPAPQGTAPVTVADALAKAAELADMDAVGGYRSDGSTASSSGGGGVAERHHVQMPASADLPATSGRGPEASHTSEIQAREYERQDDGRRGARAEVAPPAFEIGPGDEGPPEYNPWAKPHKGAEAENKVSLSLIEGAVASEADWAVGPGFVSSSGKGPVAVVEVPVLVEPMPEPVDGILRQKALSAGTSPALSPSRSKKIGMPGSTWVSPRLLTSAMSLSKKRNTAPEEERSSGGESADETSPRGGVDKHRRFPSFSRNRGMDAAGVWTGSASGASSGVSADISQISWPIGRPEVQRQGLSVRAAKMDAAMRREEIARGMFEGPMEQAPGIDISWPVGRPGGVVRVMSRAEASRLVTAGAGITGLPPSIPAPAPAPAAGWVPTPRPPGLPYEMSRSTSAPASGPRAFDGSQHGPPHVVEVPRSSSAVFDSGRSSQGTSSLMIQVPRTSGSAPELVQSISFGNVGSLNLVSVGGHGLVASADSLVMRPVNPVEGVNPASYELQWQALYGGSKAGGGNPGDEDQWARSEGFGPVTGVVVSPVPSSGDGGRPGTVEGGVFVFKSGPGEAGRGGASRREHVFGAAPVTDSYTEDVGVAVSGLGVNSCEGTGSPNKRTSFEKVGGSGTSSFGGNRALNGEAEGFRMRGSGPRTATVVPQSADTKLRTEELLPVLEMANKSHFKRDSFRQYYTWQQQASASDEAFASTDIAQLTAMAKARGQPVPKGGGLPGMQDADVNTGSAPAQFEFPSPTRSIDTALGRSRGETLPLSDGPPRSSSTGHLFGGTGSGRHTPQRRHLRSQNPLSLNYDIDRIGS